MYKKIMLILGCLFLFGGASAATKIEEADKAFELRKYQEAYNIYSEIAADNKAAMNTIYKSQLRAAESLIYLAKFSAAAKDIYSYSLPSNPVWKARFLLYRTSILERLKNQYRYGRPFDEEETEGDSVDFDKLTGEQLEKMIEKDYDALWSIRKSLINAQIQNENIITYKTQEQIVSETDVESVPTLYDFAAAKMINYIESKGESYSPLIKAADIVGKTYAAKPVKGWSYNKILEILAESNALGGNTRRFAKENAQIERVMLPFKRQDMFIFKDSEDEPSSASGAVRTARAVVAPVEDNETVNHKEELEKAAATLLYFADYDEKTGKETFLRGSGFGASSKASAAYEAANIYNTRLYEYEKAYNVCAYAVKNLGDNYYTQMCRRMQESISAPVLNAEGSAISPNPKNIEVPLTVRNAENVYLRLYKVTPAQLKTLYKRNTSNSYRYLKNLNTEVISGILKEHKPVLESEISVSYDKKYGYSKLKYAIPEQPVSMYVALFSYHKDFANTDTDVVGKIINVSDIMLAGIAKIAANPDDFIYNREKPNKKIKADTFRLYTLNPLTGEGVEGAKIMSFITENYDTYKTVNNTSDAKGEAVLSASVPVGPNKYFSQNLDSLAIKGDSHAFFNNPLYLNASFPEHFRVFIETDRAIYRPGQDVEIKLTVFERVAGGYKSLNDKNVDLIIRDANYQEIEKKTLKLSDFGTASHKAALPEKGLLGNYNLEVTGKVDGIYLSSYQSFKVEEYKRPEFEVTLKDSSASWKYDKAAKVEGGAKYYFGAPVQNAKVKYTVTREQFTPLWYWWWHVPASPPEEVANGTVQTDKDGHFSFTFTPAAKDKKEGNIPSRFVVKTEVIDESGRVIKADKTYAASKQNVFFKIDKNFGFIAADSYGSLDISLTDVNGNPVKGSGTVTLYTVENKITEPKGTNSYGGSQNIEAYYAQSRDIAKAYETSFSSNKKPVTITLPSLDEGVYRLKVSSGQEEEKVLLFVIKDGKTLQLPAVAIAEKSKYYPGETARVLVGASAITHAKYVSLTQNGYLTGGGYIAEPKATVYEIPVTEAHRGSFAVTFFGVSGYEIYTANTAIAVPFDNKELDIKLSAPQAVEPGAEVTLSIEAKNKAKTPVTGEAVVKVYDKSLDYYAKNSFALDVPALYRSNIGYYDMFTPSYSLFDTYSAKLSRKAEWKAYPSQLPAVAMYMDFSPGRYYGYGSVKMARSSAVFEDQAEYAMDAAVPTAAPMAAKQESARNKLGEGGNTGAVLGGGALDTGGIEIRSDMSETAYFNAHLPVTNGKASASFKMPQRLTAWNISANVITKDAMLGIATEQTITKKDFMVRIEMPRFFREGDKGQIKAVITNATDKNITAELSLIVKDQRNEDAYQALGIASGIRKVNIKADSQASEVWDVTADTGVKTLRISAVARTNTDTDGEVKELPILSSRERIVDSKVVALKEGENTLGLTLRKDGEIREYEVAALQVDPSLMLPVLNSMPLLLSYPNYLKTVPGMVTEYIPLAILNKFYNEYPELKAAVAKIPTRTTITPPWDETDPLRLMALEETPYLEISKGRNAFMGEVVDIFNPKLVDKKQKKAVAALKKAQNSDGGFAWMAGGDSDTYITLYVLENMALALSHGVEIPEELAKKAISYVAPKVTQMIDRKEGADVRSVSMIIYSAYVLSSFPTEWKETESIMEDVKKWAEYSDKEARHMTPLGKIYAANIFHVLDDSEKSDNYLDQVLDMLQTDDVTGAYFTPEAKSWLWYSDTLEKHAVTLRTLLKLRPDSDKIEPMVKWMMFNRLATEWKNTKAAAAAVYTYLDVMKSKGGFDSDTSYKIEWGTVKEEKSFKPFDFISDPVRYIKRDTMIKDADMTATVEKSGPAVDFASLTAVYSTDALQKESAVGQINIGKTYFRRVKDGDVYKLKPIKNGEAVEVGDEIEVHLAVSALSQFEYVMIIDPRPAGFEAETLSSGWQRDLLYRYEEPRDNVTNFFVNWLPHGEYTLKYRMRPTTKGTFRASSAVIQSAYAPEFAAHSAGQIINVK
ncbi:Alpha-2-macroglobulin family N-terminal region [Parelusimicrobium proximum]|uniref:alpha-2-macroglobulin family protein n=1 Tax=Parelusimicrobium proximum TaxID=3228953 RepID=UPI003D16A023